MGRPLSEPQPVLDLFMQYDGLMVLGDPSTGEMTFSKFLTLALAAGQGKVGELPSEVQWERAGQGVDDAAYA